ACTAGPIRADCAVNDVGEGAGVVDRTAVVGPVAAESHVADRERAVILNPAADIGEGAAIAKLVAIDDIDVGQPGDCAGLDAHDRVVGLGAPAGDGHWTCGT